MLPPKHCNINLTGPIPRWDEAIPLGNGILGSLFWGPMEHLRISVDIAGLWLRRRRRKNSIKNLLMQNW